MAGKKKGGLGKGLDAIFAENDMEDANATVTLKISEIEPNRAQPRKDFNDEALAELADSIAQHGVLQPLLVRPLLGGGYQIVAGERRWRAARMAGVSEVPVVIREMSDHEVMELALIENLQREDLTPLEEAQGYQSLIDQYGMTQEEISRTVGKSPPRGGERAPPAASAGGPASAGLRREAFRGPCPHAARLFGRGADAARRRSWLWSRVYRCASWKSL